MGLPDRFRFAHIFYDYFNFFVKIFLFVLFIKHFLEKKDVYYLTPLFIFFNDDAIFAFSFCPNGLHVSFLEHLLEVEVLINNEIS